MPLGAARLTLLAFQPTVAVVAEVIRKKVGIIPASAAQIVTADSKFGGSSFDSVHTSITSHLTIKKSDFSRFNTGTGAFTVEGWFKPTSAGADGNSRFFYFGGTVNGANSFGCSITTGGGIFRGPSTGDLNFTKSNTGWLHYAFVYDGTNKSVYCDGTRLSTTAASLNVTDSTDIKIGSHIADSRYNFDGYIDELRVSDVARYTGTSYSVPTTTFVNDDDTILLLHCDGSNGSQFFDDDNGVGRSAVGVKAIGNAQIDTAQSKFGGASALFDGTGDYLQFPNNIITASDDFTVEAWIRLDIIPPSNNNWQMLLGNAAGGGNAIYMAIKNRSGTIVSDIVLSNGSGSFIEQEYTISSISANTWYHWAICKSGGTLKHFFNGTELTTLLASSGTMTSAFGLHIASVIGAWSAGTWNWDGYIDEFRISNTARYTASFTPQTAPFVNDANTLLLLHMDGTDARTLFLDDNGTQGRGDQVAVTANGNAQVDTAQYKFGGSSAVFDGTGDYLTSTLNSSFGTGNFTIEGWFNYDAVPTGSRGIIQLSTTAGGLQTSFTDTLAFHILNTGKARIYANGTTNDSASTPSISAATFYHWAIVRNSGVTKLYIDGTEYISISDTTNYTCTQLAIGGIYSTSFLMDGNIDEVRISNTARYTAAFTPSTTPFTNDANTLALFHFNGANASTTFLDDCGRQKISTIPQGNAQIDTAQYKFGGSSAVFDGTEDYLTFGSMPVPTGDFTIEFWFRMTSGGVLRPIWSMRDSGGTHRGTLYVNTADGLTWWTPGINLNVPGVGTIVAGTWHHIACVKEGTTVRISLDGAVYTGSTTVTTGDEIKFGKADYTGSVFPNEIYGHFDEIRISNVARYTTSFTPPTEPFQNDANTTLLLHMDGTDASTDFTDDNGKESA